MGILLIEEADKQNKSSSVRRICRSIEIQKLTNKYLKTTHKKIPFRG